MPPPVRIMRTRWGLLFTLAVLAFSAAPTHGQNEDIQIGSILDVMVVDGACWNTSDCEPVRPAHLVEYFAADWCEPCYEVSPLIDGLNRTQTAVLQHPSSPVDEAYHSASNHRFETTFRLLLYPSIVVDGEALLTGARQALDLNHTLANRSVDWGGLDNLTVANGSFHHSGMEGLSLTVYVTAPRLNEAGNLTHERLVVDSLSLNTSNDRSDVQGMTVPEDGQVVVILEQQGVRPLTVASLSPTGDMNLSDDNDASSESGEAMPAWWWPMLIGVALVAITVPALVMHRSLMDAPFDTESE